nr:methylmalonyl-CoA mutase family protein [Saprospiraceae bacterium]
EYLTQKLYESAKNLLEEIEELGGMTKALEQGIPKMRIEEAAAKKQAKIDSGEDKVLGVNIFESSDVDIDLLEVDNARVREMQIQSLQNVKKNRNQKLVEQNLRAITEACRSNELNLLELAVEAAKNRATLGEISSAMEEVFGRYVAHNNLISGVYAKEIKMDDSFQKARELSDEFSMIEGRRPRILVAKLGQDGHDRGAKIIATGFADLGFDVDIGPLFQTPKEAAKQAVENDVHILGVSSLAAGHRTLIPETIQALKDLGRDDIIVIAGGVIPPQDYQALFDAGVAAVFGPGTVLSLAAIQLLELLMSEGE